MIMTPTSNSSAIAGVGLWSLAWASLFKLDYLAKLCHCSSWVSQRRVLDWITEHKAVSLMCTEVVNFTVHGITNAMSVMFALGGTLVNVLVIFGVLPFVKWQQRTTKQELLLGAIK